MATATLSKSELKTRLEEQEARIVRAEQSYVEMGDALGIILNNELYKALDYTTVQDYAREVWHYERAHVYRMIDAAKVAKNLRQEFEQIPLKEAHARPLVKLSDDKQRYVWRKVLEREPRLGQHTTVLIEDVIRVEIPVLRTPAKRKKASTQSAPVSGTGQQDVEKHSIPKAIAGAIVATPRILMATYLATVRAEVSEPVANQLMASVEGSLTKKGNEYVISFEAPLSDVFNSIQNWIEKNELKAVTVALDRN